MLTQRWGGLNRAGCGNAAAGPVASRRRRSNAMRDRSAKPGRGAGLRRSRSSRFSPSALSVFAIVNAPRVRDGYISLGTRGHARALPAHADRSICRKKGAASDRTCTSVPLPNFHGKEGVDGSSPSEGFDEVPVNSHFIVVCPLNTRTHSGHIFGTGDAPRRLATPHGTLFADAIAATCPTNSLLRGLTVA